MTQSLKSIIYRHGYLFIAAAWLYTISFIFTNYFTYSSSPQKVKHTLEQYIAKQEQKFAAITKDTALLYELVSKQPSLQKINLTNEDIGLFAYRCGDRHNYDLVYWNSFTMSVNPADLHISDSAMIVKYRNGLFELLKYSFVWENREHVLAGLVPIHWDYFIENKYLQKGFSGYPNIEELYQINDKKGIAINNSFGKTAYYIQQKPSTSFDHPNNFSLTLRIIAILFFLSFIHMVAITLIDDRGLIKGYSFLLLTTVFIRALTYFFPIPFNFRKLELFDPGIYASNMFHPSLGDLLINSFLFYWLVSVLRIKGLAVLEQYIHRHTKKRIFIAVACLITLVLFTFQTAEVVNGLVVDSKISFDVTNFFTLNIYTLICFIILSFIILSYYYISHLLITPSLVFGMGLGARLIIVTVTSLLLVSVFSDATAVKTNFIAVGWLLGYVILLEYRKEDIAYRLARSSFFLFWILYLSLSVTGLVILKNNVVELLERKKIAEKLALQTDPSGEQLMNFGIANFNDHDFLTSHFVKFESENSNKFLKDSLITANFSGYLNKYDTRIYTYNSTFSPLYNDDSTTYHSIITTIDNIGKPTAIPELYYYENTAELFNYIYKKAILNSGNDTIGYFIFIAKPKRYKSEALYPELFRQAKDITSDLNTVYAYAVYRRNELLVNFNDYAFSRHLDSKQIPASAITLVHTGDFSELWYKAGSDKIVVVVKKDAWFIELVTFLAYLFCVAISIVMIFYWGGLLLESRFRPMHLKKMFHFNIRTQIQATIIFVSVFSFVVIGVATISFFIVRFDKNNEERLTKAIRVIASELSDTKTGLLDDPLASRTTVLSEIHNVDVNVYNTTGDLIYSTQPNIYNKQILSNKMEPRAYHELNQNKLVQYVQNEKIAQFSYLCIYVPVKDKKGDVCAYLNIPYLNSQSELNQEISGFLVTLINLNAFIFILAGAIALFITNRIIASLKLIGTKMKQINIGTANEAITWHTNDEIGALINEYNKMVAKLEESAQSLARSEREGAWREMAKQVAHEIKNPLTPMKLSIQYLQRSITAGSPNMQELSQRVSATLVEQIDQLAKIASDFSQFANIGNVQPEKFDIGEVLTALVQLHGMDEKITIRLSKSIDPAYILADKTQINRLFTNLIKNAIEASENRTQPVIIINMNKEDQFVVISVTDNGYGIPTAMHAKLFTPNFTTKSSGTGLGLAICKGIVENANGAIHFKTTEGKGTTFVVTLSLEKS